MGRLHLTLIVAVAVQLTWYRVEAAALGDTCATDTDCTATIANSACSSLACACATNFRADYSGGCSKAIGDVCAADADCSSVGGVTACTSLACACGTNYAAGTTGHFTCVAGPSATCTASGNECWLLGNAYCDTSVASPVCTCSKLFTGTTCSTATTCALDSVCTALDTNSYCLNTVCACKVGYAVNPGSTTGLCELVGSSDAKGVVASMAVLVGSLILTVLHM